jgi:hypothetical protein
VFREVIEEKFVKGNFEVALDTLLTKKTKMGFV